MVGTSEASVTSPRAGVAARRRRRPSTAVRRRRSRSAAAPSARRRGRAAAGTASARVGRGRARAPQPSALAATLPERELDRPRRAGGARGVHDERDVVLGRSPTWPARRRPRQRLVDDELGAAAERLRSRSPSRRSTGSRGARSSRQACKATTKSRAGGQRDRDAVAGRRAAGDEPARAARGGVSSSRVGQALRRGLERDRVGAARRARASQGRCPQHSG